MGAQRSFGVVSHLRLPMVTRSLPALRRLALRPPAVVVGGHILAEVSVAVVLHGLARHITRLVAVFPAAGDMLAGQRALEQELSLAAVTAAVQDVLAVPTVSVDTSGRRDVTRALATARAQPVGQQPIHAQAVFAPCHPVFARSAIRRGRADVRALFAHSARPLAAARADAIATLDRRRVHLQRLLAGAGDGVAHAIQSRAGEHPSARQFAQRADSARVNSWRQRHERVVSVLRLLQERQHVVHPARDRRHPGALALLPIVEWSAFHDDPLERDRRVRGGLGGARARPLDDRAGFEGKARAALTAALWAFVGLGRWRWCWRRYERLRRHIQMPRVSASRDDALLVVQPELGHAV